MVLGLASKLVYHFNDANDVVIEFIQLIGWYPPLCVMSAAYLLNGVPIHKFFFDLKSGNESTSIRFDVPVSSDLYGILLVRDRVKDWLLREPWWPGLVAALGDQLDFFRASRPEECYGPHGGVCAA